MCLSLLRISRTGAQSTLLKMVFARKQDYIMMKCFGKRTRHTLGRRKSPSLAASVTNRFLLFCRTAIANEGRVDWPIVGDALMAVD